METLAPEPAQRMAATLGLEPSPVPAGTLPPLWHWLYFLDTTVSAALGDDGVSLVRPLLPPVPLPQVVWGGCEIEFLAPLRLGEPTRKVSLIEDIAPREGSRGEMVVLTWKHSYEQQGQPAVVERTRAIFLGAATGAAARAAADQGAPPDARQQEGWLVNEAVLFRYSALTFNSHRIHYDHPYARGAGGYPGLVVHGPLQATLIAETFRRWHPRERLRQAKFRARAPLYCSGEVRVGAAARQGGSFSMWTQDPAGAAAMDGVLTI